MNLSLLLALHHFATGHQGAQQQQQEQGKKKDEFNNDMRITMIMYPRNMVCFRYVIAYTLHTSDNKYNNNNNNNNSVLLSRKDMLELNS